VIRSSIVLACSLFAIVAGAAEPASLLAKIDAASRATQSLSAEFTQKNRMKLFKQELSAKGRLLFRAPRQIRWEYLSPDPSVLVLDGNKAQMRSPGAPAQVFDLDKDTTMRAVFDQLLTFVGGGSIADAKSAYGVDAQGKPGAPTLVLTPKPGSAIAKTFARIELGFDDKTQVRSIRLVEQNGDEKEIAFGRVVRNGALPAHAFE
jgi:outer membrane lipoprotein carrier protein